MPEKPADAPTAATRSFPQWEERYQTQTVDQMPWFYPELDPDVRGALDAEGLSTGRLLDIGTGPGTQATALAKLGFEVTATDISQTAIDKATARAAAEGARLTFLRDDILAPSLKGSFDIALDRGCFHVMDAQQRIVYLKNITELLKPRGLLLLKTFSSKQPGEQGPYRFTPEELRELFKSTFDIQTVRESVYQGTLTPLPLALFSVMRRRDRRAVAE